MCFLFFVCFLSPLVWFFLLLPEEVLALLFLLQRENGVFSILMKDNTLPTFGIVWKIVLPVAFYVLHQTLSLRKELQLGPFSFSLLSLIQNLNTTNRFNQVNVCRTAMNHIPHILNMYDSLSAAQFFASELEVLFWFHSDPSSIKLWPAHCLDMLLGLDFIFSYVSMSMLPPKL